MTKKQIIIKSVCFAAIAVIVVICIVGTVFAARYRRNITAILCGSGAEVDAEAGEFSSKLGDDLVKRAGEESMVLLRNEADEQGNTVLPLAEKSKVNVYGAASSDQNWIVTGAGSGTGVIDPQYKQTFLTSLKDAGLEYNQALVDFYASEKPVREKNPYNLKEPDLITLKQKVSTSSAKEWSNTAIVVLGRYAGETIDEIPLKQSANKTYLDLTDQEGELLNYLNTEAGFENIIVVINAANAMNLSFLENKSYGIDACLLTGFTGQSAAYAIGRILCGKTNPSGKTSDIFPYFPNNSNYDPTWANNRNVASDLVTTTDNMVEAEGIYYGYKWYETAAEEGFFGTTAYGRGYYGVVQYPFGYGLSYTDFSWSIKDISLASGSALAADSEITLTVSVKNEGDRAGKDVVELYSTPPYIKGGIEKAHVNLIDFAKTELIPAGETRDVTLSFSAYDLASYDCYDLNENGHTAWELDPGDYVLSLRTDSHTVKDFAGAEIAYTVSGDDALVIDKDPVTEHEVTNRLTGDAAYAGVSVDGTNVGLDRSVYMTRADFKGTFPKTRTEGPSRNHEKMKIARTYMNPTYETDTMPETGSAATSHKLVTLEDGTAATFAQLNGKWGDAKPVYNNELIQELASDYGSPKWQQLVSQMSTLELKQLFHFGGFQTHAIESIGKVRNIDYDGPAGFNLTALKGSWEGGIGAAEEIEKLWTVWPSEAILGCSWNKELLLEIGLFMGMEAQNTNVSGWYAPGLNLHRSPYTNRNFEYYSEDAVLSGNLGANLILGAKMNNLYCYMKHFVCCEYGKNPGDTNTWLTEQSLRENAMRVFEIAVKEGGGNAIMTAFNNVGPVWAGANYATCTQVLRDEWGFKGTLLTDICSYESNYEIGKFNHQQGLRAGQDIWLNHTTTMFNDIDEKDPTMIAVAQRAARNIIWTSVDTYNFASTYDRSQLNAIFRDDGETDLKYAIELSVRVAPTVNEWWIPLAIVIEALVLAGCGVWLFFLIRAFVKDAKKPKNNDDGADVSQNTESANA